LYVLLCRPGGTWLPSLSLSTGEIQRKEGEGMRGGNRREEGRLGKNKIRYDKIR
jgi:hypothetical protein